MSQASKAIKEIAAGQEYTSLVQATEKSDYEAITNAYRQLANLLEEKKKAILEQIDSLPKQNAEENRQQFLTAFTQRMESSLPQFYKLFKLISEQKIAEGEVFDTGSKGDPIIRTPDGKTVIVSGVKAEKGVRIKYKVTNEGQKFDFARAIELNADFFYTMLNQEITGRIQEAFNAVEARMRSGTQEITPNSLNELLAGLEKARETACGLKTAEQEQTNGRILALRKRLLGDYGIRLAFDFIAREEEKEIRTLYAGDEQKASLALAAPGIFRRQGYYAFKNGLFAGRNLKGKEEIQKTLESNVETMDSALKLMEFSTSIEELEPSARGYVSKMDEFFDKLNSKARFTTYAIAEEKTFDANEIQGKMENAFSGNSLYAEIKRVFRGPGDFFTSREAAVKIKAALGDKEIQAREAAVRPYIKKVINQVFERRTAGFSGNPG